MAMSVEDQIKREKMAIMKHKKFCAFSGVLACGKVTVDKKCSTAMTDGWNLWFNPDFIKAHASTPEKLRFLILHEGVHVAYRHLHVWRALWKEDAQLANVAMDHFVNLSLTLTDAREGFIEMLDVGIQPEPRYKGWSVSQIFNDLKQQQQKQPPEQGEGEGEGDGMDSHDWENASDGDASTKQGDEIQRAIRQGEMMAKKLQGKGAGGSDGVFGDLLNPKIDWKRVLRDFVSELCAGRDESSWRKVNRRMVGDGMYMPGNVGTTMRELVVGFDTSGSCFNGAEMTRFVTEIKTIIEQVCPSKVHVIYWDTAVCGHQTFEDGQFVVQNLKPKGGGGTDGSVLFEYLRSKRIKPDAIVQFTDGYVGKWGHTDVPTMWAVTTDSVAPFGITIKVEM